MAKLLQRPTYFPFFSKHKKSNQIKKKYRLLFLAIVFFLYPDSTIFIKTKANDKARKKIF